MSASSNRTATTNNRTLKLFKSRTTLIEQLDQLDYDISEYEDFSINEVDAMNVNNQLHMTLSHRKDNRKIHVKYYLTSKQTSQPMFLKPLSRANSANTDINPLD